MSASSGFAAMGKPVPAERQQAAYDAASKMGVEKPFTLINGMAKLLEKDKPFEALQLSRAYVDVTGSYMLLAYLLTGKAS